MFNNKIFMNNLNLETSWDFIFTTTRRSTKHFPQFGPNLVQLIPLTYISLSGTSGTTFEFLETNLKILIS